VRGEIDGREKGCKERRLFKDIGGQGSQRGATVGGRIPAASTNSRRTFLGSATPDISITMRSYALLPDTTAYELRAHGTCVPQLNGLIRWRSILSLAGIAQERCSVTLVSEWCKGCVEMREATKRPADSAG
jgi:hypothetical protein